MQHHHEFMQMYLDGKSASVSLCEVSMQLSKCPPTLFVFLASYSNAKALLVCIYQESTQPCVSAGLLVVRQATAD